MNKLVLLLSALLLCNCSSSKKNDAMEIGNGLWALPEFFQDHYYRFPENVNELYSFLQNHYEYEDAKEYWDPSIRYMIKNEHNLNVISEKGLFIIYNEDGMSYSKFDICDILTMHYPEKYYFDWGYVSKINLYDLKGRNIKEIIGINSADSIADIFRKQKNELYNLENNPVVNDFVKFDKWYRVLLQYDRSYGLETFCPQEPLVLSDYPFFIKIEELCRTFCEQYSLGKIIFVCTVFEPDKH